MSDELMKSSLSCLPRLQLAKHTLLVQYLQITASLIKHSNVYLSPLASTLVCTWKEQAVKAGGPCLEWVGGVNERERDLPCPDEMSGQPAVEGILAQLHS